MKVLIIEDEQAAANRLQRQLHNISSDLQILDVIDTVAGSLHYLAKQAAPDLIFMDIQLADGLSFAIFNQLPVQAPVIFTTAFDQYAIQAFKVNSIDYLLKPIDHLELKAALDKFRQLHQPRQLSQELLSTLQQQLFRLPYKERFFVKAKGQFYYIPVGQVALIYAEDGINFIRTDKGQRFMLSETLEDIEKELNPSYFHRINRKMILQLSAIATIKPHLNSRLIIETQPAFGAPVIVSRERVAEFKRWLGQS